jgi:hypothetical protein
MLGNWNLKIEHEKVHKDLSVLPQKLTERNTNDEIIQNGPESTIKP